VVERKGKRKRERKRNSKRKKEKTRLNGFTKVPDAFSDAVSPA
jgi:hypothetical protein